MRRNVLLLIGIGMSLMSFGQNYPEILLEEMRITPPEFRGVETTWQGHEIESIHDYLEEFVQYPQRSDNYGLMGTEVVEFLVTVTGELTDFKVINSVSSEIDEEVIGVLQVTSGRWNPGFIDGEPVPMKKEISVVFRPNDSYNLTEIAKKYLEKGNEKLFVMKDPKRALKYYDRAIKLLPNEVSLLAARSLCKHELGDEQGAQEDCERLINLDNTGDFQLEAAYPIEAMKQL